MLLVVTPSIGQPVAFEVTIRLNQGVEMYETPTGSRGTTLPDTTLGVIVEIGTDRVLVQTEVGETGWVEPSQVMFEVEPSGFLDSLPPRQRRMFIVGETVWNKTKEMTDMLSEIKGMVNALARKDSLSKEGVAHNIEAKLPIAITTALMSRNTSGGHGLYLKFTNTSESVIKYLNLQFEAFNPVGDHVEGENNGENRFLLRLIGPIESKTEAKYDLREEPSFYSATATCFELAQISLDFMNGSSVEATDIVSELLVVEFSTVKAPYGCPYHIEQTN